MKWYLLHINSREIEQFNNKRHAVYSTDSDSNNIRERDGVYRVEKNRTMSYIIRNDKLKSFLKEYDIDKNELLPIN